MVDVLPKIAQSIEPFAGMSIFYAIYTPHPNSNLVLSSLKLIHRFMFLFLHL